MGVILTIAIPTYNRCYTLKRALEAIAEQDTDMVEILICDDASRDDTEKIVADIQKKHRLPIRYIKNNVNLGYDKNFLQCFKEAKGKYVLLMGDDDILIDLNHVLEYLRKHEVDWAYVNFASFDGEWIDIENSCEYTLTVVEDKVNVSKKEFMNYAQFALTADTTVVNKTKILDFSRIEKYIGTCFIQTCLPLEITKSEESVLGIIGKPCIALNTSHEDRHVYKKWRTYFQVFAVGLKSVLCDIAPSCGYDKCQMEKIFKKGILNMAYPIAYMKSNDLEGWRTLFWHEGYPAIKKYLITWIFIIPIVIMPRFFAKFLLNIVYPIFHKISVNRRKHTSF